MYVVLFSELWEELVWSSEGVVGGMRTFGERGAHDGSADAGRSGEVSLASLSPAGVQTRVDFRHFGGDGGCCGEGGIVVAATQVPLLKLSKFVG